MPPPAARRFALVLALAAGTARADDPAGHWAWKPPARPAVPGVRSQESGVRNPIDAFVRARLAEKGLTPAPPADPRTLVRRVTFDLTGLPPTPEEVASFEQAAARDPRAALESLIDRLLASPAYGERWGRHWLDLARYADTNGFEHDEVRPNAWRYRDYVIAAFNADKPFDRFVLEQLAGDQAFPDDPAARVATGFNLLGPDMTDSADQAQRRANTLNDMTDTAGLVFLGLTVTCARCHDHKFEPIPQADYFRLQAFFAPADFRHDLPAATAAEQAAHAAKMKEYRELTKDVRDAITAIEKPHRDRIFEAKVSKLPANAQAAHRKPADRRNGGEQELVAETARKVAITDAEVVKAMSAGDQAKHAALLKQLKPFDAKKPPPLPTAIGLADKPGAPPKTFILERGELSNRGDEVKPGFVSVVSSRKSDAAGDSHRRLALAKWVTSPDNPLTARVIVNRLWQHHFGRGIVPTASDFGVKGERPTHPELLDWLACELVEPTASRPGHGAGDAKNPTVDTVGSPWSLKRLHKLMLLSETYQQSTQVSREALAKDPDNALFSRMNRLRLEGEAVRDSLLAVSGRLNRKAGGPGVVPPVAAEAVAGSKGAWAVSPDPADHVRRSVYLFNRRNLRHPFLEAFDLPDSNLSCPKRERSTTAPQSLALLNADEVLAAAKATAARLEAEAATPAARIDRAYRLALGRPPTPTEAERTAAFLKDSPLSELCRALFNLNEFVYLD